MAIAGHGLHACVALLLLAGAGRVRAQAPAAPPPAPARPPRVVTDVSTFHLDRAPRSGSAPNQIGAASRGGTAIIALCAPSDGLASDPRPLFVWKTSDPGQQLTFSLLSDAGDVLYEGAVTSSQLEYPADAPALEAGKTYSWKVSGGGVDKLPDPVSFTLLDKQARETVALKLAKESTDPLARAQLFLRNQLWYDAEAALLAGLHEQPTRGDLAQQLRLLDKQVAPGCAQ